MAVVLELVEGGGGEHRIAKLNLTIIMLQPHLTIGY